MTSEEFVARARTWLDVPFHHQGRSRLGTDCAGYIECLILEAGLAPPGYSAPRNYARRPQAQLKQVLDEYLDPTTKAGPGVIVLICFPQEAFASHVAVCTGPNIIHCYERVKKVVEHGYREPWLRWTAGFYRVRGLTYV